MPKLPSPRYAADAAPPPVTILSRSLRETVRLGEAIGKSALGGEVLALYGELGSGKTAFVRGLAAGLGAKPRGVSSPTFVLIHEYHGRLRLAHADLYRLNSVGMLAQLGLDEYFDGRTVVAIEWAERALDELPLDRIDIHFTHQSQTERHIMLSSATDRAVKILERIVEQTTRLKVGKS